MKTPPQIPIFPLSFLEQFPVSVLYLAHATPKLDPGLGKQSVQSSLLLYYARYRQLNFSRFT
jgi:hypothetical protein